MAAKATIRDIAKACGTSITTVSLVLNQRPNKISQPLQDKIVQTAEEMGYVSRQKSRPAARGARIGIVVPDIENRFFASLVRGAEEAALQEGFRLSIGISCGDPALEAETLQDLARQDAQALLIATTTVSQVNDYQALIASFRRPVILVDRVYASLACSSLTFNHRKGGYYATSHLLGLGHRRIACLSGEGAVSVSASQRIKGYRLAMEEWGVPVSDKDVFRGDYQEESGYRMADKILEGGYTALFSCNDLMACGVYRRLHERGLVIPRDLSVVGYDDQFISTLLQPALTTVKQDPVFLGQEAVKRAILEMSDPALAHQDIYFEPSLVIRNSTAEPAKADRPATEG